MKVLGIIVEYNPFHNGHIYHIKKAKEISKCDYTIAIMSSHFVQRGEPAIIDKKKRAALAIEFGVDLVIELPLVFAVESADYFAHGALMLLNAIGVTDLCFGSEDGHIETFIDIAIAINKNKQQYDTLVKQLLDQGIRYADATNQALNIILQKEIKTPNDLLGLAYVKEIIDHSYPITPHCFKRTNHYHDTTIQTIASASAIRNAIYNQQAYALALPHSELYQHYYKLNDLFPYLKYQIITSTTKQLQQYHLVDEGIEYALKKHIHKANNIEEFIQLLLSKRYTKPRIQRMLIHILLQNTKEDINEAMKLDYIRLLAMNKNGQVYLKLIKKQCPYHIVSRFSSYQHIALDIECKATQLLSLIDQNITSEYEYIPYIKRNEDNL